MNFNQEQLLKFIAAGNAPLVDKIKSILLDIEQTKKDGVTTNKELAATYELLTNIDQTFNQDLTKLKTGLNDVEQKAEELKRFMAELESKAGQAIEKITAVEPWSPGEYPHGRIVKHGGGIYQSIKETKAEPGTAATWILLIDGIKSATHEDGQLIIETADGEIIKTATQGPKGLGFVMRECKPGQTFYKNDVVPFNGAAWVLVADETKELPPNDGWRVFAKRGPRGLPGQPGPMVSAEKLNPLIDDCFTKNYLKLAAAAVEKAKTPPTIEQIMPAATKAIQEQTPGLKKYISQTIEKSFKALELTGNWFKGSYSTNKQYGRGDGVNTGGKLYVAKAANINKPPAANPEQWQFVIAEGKASGGGGKVGQFQVGSLALSELTPITVDDVAAVKLPVFDLITASNTFITANPLDHSITINRPGNYDIAIMLNVEFSQTEELEVFFRLNGSVVSPSSISLQGIGAGKPAVLNWTFNENITIDLVPATLDIMGLNGDAGSFTAQVIRTRLSAEYKGPVYVN